MARSVHDTVHKALPILDTLLTYRASYPRRGDTNGNDSVCSQGPGGREKAGTH
jgi:hypothetical protein